MKIIQQAVRRKDLFYLNLWEKIRHYPKIGLVILAYIAFIALGMPDGHVFLVGQEIADIGHWNQLDAIAHPGGNLAACAGAGPARQGGELRPGQSPRRLQGCGQFLPPDGLEQISAGLGFEGIERILVEGGDEHHRRRFGERGQMPCNLDAVHRGHADIEQDHIDGDALRQRQCIGAVSCLTGHLDTGDLGTQPLQTFSRGRLVIHDQDAARDGAHRGEGW